MGERCVFVLALRIWLWPRYLSDRMGCDHGEVPGSQMFYFVKVSKNAHVIELRTQIFLTAKTTLRERKEE